MSKYLRAIDTPCRKVPCELRTSTYDFALRDWHHIFNTINELLIWETGSRILTGRILIQLHRNLA